MMKRMKMMAGIAAGLLLLGMSSIVYASPVVPETFKSGLNTGYSVTDAGTHDTNVDWFVFDSNGVDPVYFRFDRTVAAPDLIVGLYGGDTTGFDYVAAGAYSSYSYYNAGYYNNNLTVLSVFDDTHDDALGGPFGDPDFNLTLPEGRYSLALSSLNYGGTYQFWTNVESANTVPEPSSILLLGLGAAGLAAARLRRKKQ